MIYLLATIAIIALFLVQQITMMILQVNKMDVEMAANAAANYKLYQGE